VVIGDLDWQQVSSQKERYKSFRLNRRHHIAFHSAPNV
jgi:hypothetical protein